MRVQGGKGASSVKNQLNPFTVVIILIATGEPPTELVVGLSLLGSLKNMFRSPKTYV